MFLTLPGLDRPARQITLLRYNNSNNKNKIVTHKWIYSIFLQHSRAAHADSKNNYVEQITLEMEFEMD
jgi:hypothetical protein